MITWHYNTSTALLTKIILDLGYFIPRRGLSKDEIVEKLVEILMISLLMLSQELKVL